jgi:cell division initiation protein
MKPEDIHGRDFLVGLRGYDKEEVRSFLAEVAAEHAALLAEVGRAKAAPQAPAHDDFENLGASVASILRAAKESASEITADAEQHAAAIRSEAEGIRERAIAESDRIMTEARERAAAMESELEQQVAQGIQEASERASSLRARLLEAGDELQLALHALGGDAGAAPRREEPVDAVDSH